MSGPLQQLLLCSVQVMIHWKPVMLQMSHKVARYCSAPASRTLFKDKNTTNDERIFKKK